MASWNAHPSMMAGMKETWSYSGGRKATIIIFYINYFTGVEELVTSTIKGVVTPTRLTFRISNNNSIMFYCIHPVCQSRASCKLDMLQNLVKPILLVMFLGKHKAYFFVTVVENALFFVGGLDFHG